MKWLRTLNYAYGFFLFGVMCLLFLPIALPIACLPSAMRKPLEPWIRSVTHRAFVFVRWHCDKTGFARMKVFDHSQGSMSPLLVANHICMFDIVLLFSHFQDIQTLVNAKFLHNPLLWSIIRACGYVPLRTDSASEGWQAFDKLKEGLTSGRRLVLFPEGTRSPDGQLGPLKNGPFRLAADLQIPLTPVFFTCNQPFLNRRAFVPRASGPVLLHAYILPALRLSKPFDARTARESFLQSYEAFIHSDLGLAWNRASANEPK